jgi:hypothetical protein
MPQSKPNYMRGTLCSNNSRYLISKETYERAKKNSRPRKRRRGDSKISVNYKSKPSLQNDKEPLHDKSCKKVQKTTRNKSKTSSNVPSGRKTLQGNYIRGSSKFNS